MSIKEKYRQVEENEIRRKLAKQQRDDARLRGQQQTAIVQERQRKELERIRKEKIQDIIDRSGIKEMMREAADVKHGWVITEDDGIKIKINSRWATDVDTERPISRLRIELSSDNYPCQEVTAQVGVDSITIGGSVGFDPKVVNGRNINNRDILERAIIKALAHPRVVYSHPPPENNYPSW